MSKTGGAPSQQSADALRRCRVFRVATSSPDDVEGLLALLASGAVGAGEIRAILGKTEGNGCVNDFTRAFALAALQAALAGPLGCTPAEVGQRVAMVMSGGTEGGLSPHLLVFAAGPAAGDATRGKSLAIGTAFTRAFRPEELGRLPQIEVTAAAVAAAMADAGIADPDDVHYVQVKCPLLTSATVAAAAARGQRVVTDSTYKSMGYSRGASALGVALALGEVERAALDDDAVCRRLDLWSGRASTSAGVELAHNEVIVLGNSAGWASEDVIAHRVMRDAIDLPAVLGALEEVGLPARGQLDDAARAHVAAVLAKADPDSAGRIRGARHVMLEDSDINATRHARALVGGVLAGVIGRTDLFVSGGAEHQGPDGGGPVAIIARRPEMRAARR
jgi:cyanuric acid amidohydrolase